MKPLRLIFVVLVAVAALLGIGRAAIADPSCFLSSSSVRQGDSVTVSGQADFGNDTIRVLLDDTVQLGVTGSANGSPPVFQITVQIPSSTSAPAGHRITVEESGAGDTEPLFGFCGTLFVQQAAAPTPTPTASPIPTSSPITSTAPTTSNPPVFIPITVSQQQQQQQQQQGGGGGGGGGSGGRGGQQQQGHSQSGGSQQQQQQQQQQSGGISLPRTGADVARSTAWGAGLLAFGLVLVMFARRRRRRARDRALAALPPIEAVIVEPEQPWLRGTAHPSEFLTEADGVPPVYLPQSQQLLLPAPADDEDILTPSF